MSDNDLQQQAYNDVLDREEPRFLENDRYMHAYRFYREIADWDEDKCDP